MTRREYYTLCHHSNKINIIVEKYMSKINTVISKHVNFKKTCQLQKNMSTFFNT